MPDMFHHSFDAADALRPITIRKRATAAEIQADLSERIERQATREPRLRGCAAPVPLLSRTQRAGAPNWTVNGFPNLQPGCFTALVKIVDQARREYELVA